MVISPDMLKEILNQQQKQFQKSQQQLLSTIQSSTGSPIRRKEFEYKFCGYHSKHFNGIPLKH